MCTLSMYSFLYSCITIRYTASSDTVFYRPATLKPAATKLLELLIDLNLEGNPLFVHIFGKGGTYVYRYLTELVHRDKKYWHINIKGSIFDSGPGKYKFLGELKEAMAYAAGRFQVVRIIIALYFFVYLLGRALVDKMRRSPLRQHDIHDAIKNDPSKSPQLYLYSNADQMTTADDVTEIVKYRRENGRAVQSVCWEDTEHVHHFNEHRETYIKHCYDFMDMCMEGVWQKP